MLLFNCIKYHNSRGYYTVILILIRVFPSQKCFQLFFHVYKNLSHYEFYHFPSTVTSPRDTLNHRDGERNNLKQRSALERDKNANFFYCSLVENNKIYISFTSLPPIWLTLCTFYLCVSLYKGGFKFFFPTKNEKRADGWPDFGDNRMKINI